MLLQLERPRYSRLTLLLVSLELMIPLVFSRRRCCRCTTVGWCRHLMELRLSWNFAANVVDATGGTTTVLFIQQLPPMLSSITSTLLLSAAGAGANQTISLISLK